MYYILTCLPRLTAVFNWTQWHTCWFQATLVRQTRVEHVKSTEVWSTPGLGSKQAFVRESWLYTCVQCYLWKCKIYFLSLGMRHKYNAVKLALQDVLCLCSVWLLMRKCCFLLVKPTPVGLPRCSHRCLHACRSLVFVTTIRGCRSRLYLTSNADWSGRVMTGWRQFRWELSKTDVRGVRLGISAFQLHCKVSNREGNDHKWPTTQRGAQPLPQVGEYMCPNGWMWQVLELSTYLKAVQEKSRILPPSPKSFDFPFRKLGNQNA